METETKFCVSLISYADQMAGADRRDVVITFDARDLNHAARHAKRIVESILGECEFAPYWCNDPLRENSTPDMPGWTITAKNTNRHTSMTVYAPAW